MSLSEPGNSNIFWRGGEGDRKLDEVGLQASLILLILFPLIF